MKIKISAESGKIGYTYPGQTSAQPVYAELDPQARTLVVRTNPEIGNAVPEAVFNCRILRYIIPRNDMHGRTKSDALAWCRSHRADFEAIASGHSIIWNGNNHVGCLTDSAKKIDEALDYEAYGG